MLFFFINVFLLIFRRSGFCYRRLPVSLGGLSITEKIMRKKTNNEDDTDKYIDDHGEWIETTKI